MMAKTGYKITIDNPTSKKIMESMEKKIDEMAAAELKFSEDLVTFDEIVKADVMPLEVLSDNPLKFSPKKKIKSKSTKKKTKGHVITDPDDLITPPEMTITVIDDSEQVILHSSPKKKKTVKAKKKTTDKKKPMTTAQKDKQLRMHLLSIYEKLCMHGAEDNLRVIVEVDRLRFRKFARHPKTKAPVMASYRLPIAALRDDSSYDPVMYAIEYVLQDFNRKWKYQQEKAARMKSDG